MLFLALPLAVAVSSCKRGDDLYINPNAPSQVTPALLLTGLEVSTMNSYEGLLVKNASIYMQQNVGVNEQSLQTNRYIVNEQDFDNSWSQLYQTLYSWKDMNEKFGAANPWYAGMADVLAVMNWGLLTDLWGDVPYSEALQGAANYQAKFDTQEQVLNNMIGILDAAIVKLQTAEDANTAIPGTDDVLYGGNTDSWIRLAYTLKGRYLNRFSNKGSYNPALIMTSLNNGIQSSDEDLISAHGESSTEFNQWFDFQNNRPGYILASKTLMDSMSLRSSDIRYAYYYDTTSGTGSSPVDVVDAGAWAWGSYLAGAPSTGIRLVSFTEAKFIEAEVLVRMGNSSAAADALNAAIVQSCLTVTGGAYDGADLAVYTGANIDVSRVIYEKWLALFGSLEPYNDYRRTGFPAIAPNPDGLLNVIPKRNLTPLAERTNNPNAPTPALTDAVWYAMP